MKKGVLVLSIVLLLCAGMVIASNDVGNDNGGLGESDNVKRVEVRVEVNNFGNAFNVVNSGDGENFARVMSRVHERDRERLEFLDDAEVTSAINGYMVRGVKEEMLFGLFKVRRNVEYNVDESGEIVRTRNRFDFLYGGNQ